MIKERKKLTYREWLELHGYDDCIGCEYNIPMKAQCTYKGRECVEYHRYLKKDADRY